MAFRLWEKKPVVLELKNVETGFVSEKQNSI